MAQSIVLVKKDGVESGLKLKWVNKNEASAKFPSFTVLDANTTKAIVSIIEAGVQASPEKYPHLLGFASKKANFSSRRNAFVAPIRQVLKAAKPGSEVNNASRPTPEPVAEKPAPTTNNGMSEDAKARRDEALARGRETARKNREARKNASNNGGSTTTTAPKPPVKDDDLEFDYDAMEARANAKQVEKQDAPVATVSTTPIADLLTAKGIFVAGINA